MHRRWFFAFAVMSLLCFSSDWATSLESEPSIERAYSDLSFEDSSTLTAEWRDLEGQTNITQLVVQSEGQRTYRLRAVRRKTGTLTLKTEEWLSSSVYSALLSNWASEDVSENIHLDVGHTPYSAGESDKARTTLKEKHGWTISDGRCGDCLNRAGQCVQCEGDEFVTYWRTDGKGPGDGDEIVIPITDKHPDQEAEFTVFWGDGTFDRYSLDSVDDQIVKEYSEPGRYPVVFKGELRGLGPYWVNKKTTDDRNHVGNTKFLEIRRWGDLNLGHPDTAFAYAIDLKIRADDLPHIEPPGDLSRLFKGADKNLFAHYGAKFAETNRRWSRIGEWDLSEAENLEAMFKNDMSFNEDISRWEVSNVEDMSQMFKGNTTFNQPIGRWDTGNVEDMSKMFAGTLGRDIAHTNPFNQKINSWDVGQVEDMSRMFKKSHFDQPVNNWETKDVEDMSYMFHLTNFNQKVDSWDVSNVEDMSGMFKGSDFNRKVNDWDVSNVERMDSMFASELSAAVYFKEAAFNRSLAKWDVSQVKSMKRMFFGNNEFDQDLGAWDISNLTDLNIRDNSYHGVGGIFSRAGLSRAHYDSLLRGWSDSTNMEDDIPTGLHLDGGNSNYCAEEARQRLVEKYNWTIEDNGKAETCSSEK